MLSAARSRDGRGDGEVGREVENRPLRHTAIEQRANRCKGNVVEEWHECGAQIKRTFVALGSSRARHRASAPNQAHSADTSQHK